jgi:NTE family protein
MSILKYLLTTIIVTKALGIMFILTQSNKQNNMNAAITAPRLILNCTGMQRGKLVTFDSQTTNITADHIAACTGYPFYGIAWSKINESYLIDGSLLNNTPLRSAIKASPINEKIVYVCDIFSREQEQLPTNFLEI